VPGAHVCFGDEPPAQCAPGSHAEHTAGDVGVAGASWTVPAAHAPAGWHCDSFAADVYVPSAQVKHF